MSSAVHVEPDHAYRPALAGLRYVAVAADAEAADRVLGVLNPAERLAAGSVLLGQAPNATNVHALPVGAVVCVPHASFLAPSAALASALMAMLEPDAVVLMDRSHPARDLAGTLAGLGGAAVSWDAESVRRSDGPGGTVDITRVVDGGRTRLTQRLAGGRMRVLLTRARHALTELVDERAPARVSTLPLTLPAVVGSEEKARQGSGTDLAGAEIVVVVGRGIGRAEHVELFRRLAAALGAGLGATRVVVDLGWLPHELQVGQTGRVIAPKLYLGFGVSGAVQHQVAMRDSERVVVVNTDLEAPLCEIADVVIHGDAVAVAQQLLDEVQRAEVESA